MKILCLCDSPTLNSGFARVAQNLFKRWARAGAVIDVWGIAFLGWGYKDCPYVNQFFPAGRGGEWCQPDPLRVFLQQLQQGGYTHVWIMQDTFLLAQWDFPKALKDVCTAKGIRSMLYFPVDAPLKPEWTDIIAAVDCPVAYTEYGAREAREKFAVRCHQLAAKAIPEGGELQKVEHENLEIAVIPHGVDTTIYRPISDREKEREMMWLPINDNAFVTPDDFLMINLNSHQRRKDCSRSLEILAELKKLGVPAKLVMHMSSISDQDVNLEVVGDQLGLAVHRDWAHHSQLFHMGQGALPELPTKGTSSLLQLYNVCDLYLTTTLGEGWGLGITEAIACGTPVAMPDHTACAEIGAKMKELGMESSRVMLPCEHGGMVQELDNSRLRPRVNVKAAALAIKSYYDSGVWRNRPGLTQPVREWLNWDRIAREMLKLLKGKV